MARMCCHLAWIRITSYNVCYTKLLRTALEGFGLERSDTSLALFCEQRIRNYDPCISCSVHFLDLLVHRR